MSLVLEILEGLWNTTLYYKGMRVNVFGVHRPWKKTSYQSTLTRLHRKGYIEKKNNKWTITKSGKKYLQQTSKIPASFESPFSKTSPRNLIVMFDVPEARKAERKWLWQHLKRFNYIMVQKSVWVGPSPLPKNFKDFTKEIGLDKCIKTFKLAKPYKL